MIFRHEARALISLLFIGIIMDCSSWKMDSFGMRIPPDIPDDPFLVLEGNKPKSPTIRQLHYLDISDDDDFQIPSSQKRLPQG